jgi:uncharacterized Ntn-hydrolase superfamily protein
MKSASITKLPKHAGVAVARADKFVLRGEISISLAAKLAVMTYARYLQHLGSIGYDMLDTGHIDRELEVLRHLTTSDNLRNRKHFY